MNIIEGFEKIVIATSNPSKKVRYRRILDCFAKEFLDLNDSGVIDKPSEIGVTAEENRMVDQKAEELIKEKIRELLLRR